MMEWEFSVKDWDLYVVLCMYEHLEGSRMMCLRDKRMRFNSIS